MSTPTLRLLDLAITCVESNRRAHIDGPAKAPYPGYDQTTQEILSDYQRSRSLIINALNTKKENT